MILPISGDASAHRGPIFITDSMGPVSTRPRLVRFWRSAVCCACRAARNRWTRERKKKERRRRKEEKKVRACTCRDAVVQGRFGWSRGEEKAISRIRVSPLALSDVEIVIHGSPSFSGTTLIVISITRRSSGKNFSFRFYVCSAGLRLTSIILNYPSLWDIKRDTLSLVIFLINFRK